MKTVLYIKHDQVNMPTAAATPRNSYYCPQSYINNNYFNINPKEEILVLLNVDEMVSNLAVCCGRFTGISKEKHLCLLIRNNSTDISIMVLAGSTLVELLNAPNVESQMSCISFDEFHRLYAQFPHAKAEP